MDGAQTGLANTATATVMVTDENDNPPSFRQRLFRVAVLENQAGPLILAIPVDDEDQRGTDNWNAVFSITRGNEGGHFRVETDTHTNEGLLYIVKVLHRLRPLLLVHGFRDRRSGFGVVLVVIDSPGEHNHPPSIICTDPALQRSVTVTPLEYQSLAFKQPFTFTLPPENSGKWSLQESTGSSVVLQLAEPVPAGFYGVPLVVRSGWGVGEVQTVPVRVCECVSRAGHQECVHTLVRPRMEVEVAAIISISTLSLLLTAAVILEKPGEPKPAADVLLHYGYEGGGSPTGPLSDYSDEEEHDPLDFLDTLGPTFKHLADICTGKVERQEDG
ncbi:hypothetical protein ACEWY4_014109 [Coilia grayii]|uniref:Cadherin domain-containing protein n=1 Tax=Coilia grayii TaxID=363190 RepID=A0ABD1JRD4_9TELE